MEEQPLKQRLLRSTVLSKGSFDPETYEYDSSFRPWDGADPLEIHTTSEMLEYLRSNKHVEVDAKILTLRKYSDGRSALQTKKMGKASLMESFDKDVGRGIKVRRGGGRILELREDAFGGQGFGFGGFNNGSLGSTLVGNDFTPLLGGPFYKNLYFYTDYIRMHAEAFFAFHNDPFARAIVEITKNFVLGTGFELQCDMTSQTGRLAMAAWRAFEEVNEMQIQADQFVTEQEIYGESMFWELPGNNTKITYRLGPTDTRPLGIIPRVRIIDPSNLVEIITYPEDITRALAYVWLQPTQYQIYQGGLTTDASTRLTNIQPSLKFIYRQIPADQMMHFKINCVSNEKRGRSSYFPIFNYLKRLRDAVNYQMISLEKVAAWSIDTSIEGDQTDIDAYIRDQAALGTIPPPGSEFVHSKGITREYQGNQHASHASSDVLQWCLSAIAAGSLIPTSWFGTHLSGGQTRASALVATEPVTKRMEHRRENLKRMLKKMWNLCMLRAGLPQVDCDVILPELITQDRSQKLKDILLAEQARWLKPERAATLAAKELGVQKYNYNEELQDMDTQIPEIPMPIVDPGQINPPTSMQPGQQDAGATGADDGFGGTKTPLAGLTSEEKRDVKSQDTTL